MRALALVALVACKSGSPAGPTPIGNHQVDTAPAPVLECRVEGVVVDYNTGEVLAGATLIASGVKDDEVVAVSGNAGQFELNVRPTHDKLTVYYADTTGQGTLDRTMCGRRIRVPFVQAASPSGMQPVKITIFAP